MDAINVLWSWLTSKYNTAECATSNHQNEQFIFNCSQYNIISPGGGI